MKITTTSESLIGRKMYGFKFETSLNGISYSNQYMDRFIGKIGIISSYSEEYYSYNVIYEQGFHGNWAYPASEVVKHLVPLEVDQPNEEVLLSSSLISEFSITGSPRHTLAKRWNDKSDLIDDTAHMRVSDCIEAMTEYAAQQLAEKNRKIEELKDQIFKLQNICDIRMQTINESCEQNDYLEFKLKAKETNFNQLKDDYEVLQSLAVEYVKKIKEKL